MNLMGMRFRDFTWPHNPTALTLALERNVKETALPYRGSRLEDLGEAKRRITGEGYFTGEDCGKQWRQLQAVFRRGGPGSLQLPGQEPFLAVMDSLKLLGRPGGGPHPLQLWVYRAPGRGGRPGAGASTPPRRGRACGTTPGAMRKPWRR